MGKTNSDKQVKDIQAEEGKKISKQIDKDKKQTNEYAVYTKRN